jgi:hypothetical protein
MAAAWTEPPEQTWGAIRLATVALEKLGYQVDRIIWADGRSTLAIR